MGRPSKINISEHIKIIELYCSEKESLGKIGKLYGVCAESIGNIIKKHNISIRSSSETNKLSTKFSFNNINKEKAFVLGVIYGDGSISIRQDYINITSGDLDILEKSKLVFGEKFKIVKVKNSNCYRGVIYSHKLCEELFELFGLSNNKSDKLIFPKLEDGLMPSFISGYLATDGCVTITRNKSRTIKNKYIKPSLTIGFYSCSNKYLTNLKEYLELALNISISFYERKNISGHLGKKPLFHLQIAGKNAIKFIEYIINSTTINTQCDRKINVYSNFKKLLQT